MLARVLAAQNDYLAGTASLGDLQREVEAAAVALDNSESALRGALVRLAPELEAIEFGEERGQQAEAVAREFAAVRRLATD